MLAARDLCISDAYHHIFLALIERPVSLVCVPICFDTVCGIEEGCVVDDTELVKCLAESRFVGLYSEGDLLLSCLNVNENGFCALAYRRVLKIGCVFPKSRCVYLLSAGNEAEDEYDRKNDRKCVFDCCFHCFFLSCL